MSNSQAPKHNSRIAAFLPSLTDVMFLLPLAFVLARAEGVRDMIEGDTGWHIRAGEWMLANGQIARTDMFSFTRPGETWYAWEWLWDVGAGYLHQHGGMAAVTLMTLLVLCLTSAMLFRLVLRMCPYRIAAAVIAFLAVAASSLHWWVRPHMVSWLFAVMTMWVVVWHESGERRWLWTLPLLTALWVNIHGAFLILFVILGCYAAGHILSAALDYFGGGEGRQARLGIPYILTGIGCLAASFVNPYTYHLHAHILGFFGGSELMFRNVGEWQSISFQNPIARFFEIYLAIAVLAAVHAARKGRAGAAILVILWIHMALTAGRHIPVFALVAAPVLGQSVAEWIGGLSSLRPVWGRWLAARVVEFEAEFGAIDRLPRVYLTSLAGVGVLSMAILSPAPPNGLRAAYAEKRYPIRAIGTLPASAFEGKIYTDDEWGDYLIYRLGPSVKVFLDGRFDFYGKKHFEDYLEIQGCKYDWERRLSRHQIDGVLTQPDHCLATTMKESRNWSAVYDDGTAILFRRRGARPHVSPATMAQKDIGRS